MRQKNIENKNAKTVVEKIAYKDNQVTQVEGRVIKRDSCTEIQAKIITYLAAMVKEGDTSDTIYAMDVSKFLRMINENSALGGSQYNIVKNNLAGLRKLGLDIQITVNNSTKIIGFPFIYKYEYDSKAGTINFQLHDELINFYSNYDRRFTMIDVSTIMRLQNKYAIPLYEFLLSWRGIKIINCTTDKLRKILSILPKKYERASSFFDYCVYPAIEEINDKTNIKIEMIAREMYRRQILKVEFRISANNTPVEEREKEKLQEPLRPTVIFLTDAGVIEKTARKIANIYSEKRIKGNFEYAKKVKLEGTVKNFSAFLIKAIENDYAHVEINDLFGDQIVAEEKAHQEKKRMEINAVLKAEEEQKLKETLKDKDKLRQSGIVQKHPWLLEHIEKAGNDTSKK
jgi:plasmid replication initiation protein